MSVEDPMVGEPHVLIPILIGGTGRSGTTILRRILSLHPQVASIPTELRIIVDPNGALDLLQALSKRWSPYRADSALHKFLVLLEQCRTNSFANKIQTLGLRSFGMGTRSYATLALGNWFGQEAYARCTEILLRDLARGYSRGTWIGSTRSLLNPCIYEAGPMPLEEAASNIACFFHDLFRCRASAQIVSHWVEDTPENLLCSEELLELFPYARLIHVYRDPRDVLVSYRQQRWGGANVELIAQRLAGIYARWFELQERVAGETYMEISLEQLCANPRVALASICDFMGLPWNERLLEIPLERSNSGRWRYELNSAQIETVNKYLDFAIRELGYSEPIPSSIVPTA